MVKLDLQMVRVKMGEIQLLVECVPMPSCCLRNNVNVVLKFVWCLLIDLKYMSILQCLAKNFTRLEVP